MKVYSGETTSALGALIIPSGRTIPRGVRKGEIFHLEADMPKPENPAVFNSWFPRGTYICDGLTWHKLNDAGRQCKSEVIGAQTFEIGINEDSYPVSLTIDPPSHVKGTRLSGLVIKPSNIRAAVSGFASFWIDVSSAAHVCAAVFRGSKMVGLALQYATPGTPSTFSVSFMDLPAIGLQFPEDVTYELRLFVDAPTKLHVNKCNRFTFEGMGQTAFTVQENT